MKRAFEPPRAERFAPLRRLRRDERGSTATIMAFALLPILAASGVAIDLLHAIQVQSQLGHAVDAAALAGARAIHDGDPVAEATKFFHANLSAGVPATASIEVDRDKAIVSVSTTAAVATNIMKLFGKDAVTVEASAAAQSAGANGMELALVLDVTGSMKGSKLASLKTSANDLLTTLYKGGETRENLWVGVVPFAGRVNVKPHREWMTTKPFLWELWWAGCTDQRSGANASDDSPPSEEKFPEFKPNGSVFNAWQYCPPNPVLPLTPEKSSIKAVIDALEAEGNTRTDIGMSWAWRVLSPSWRGVWNATESPKDYDSKEVRKIVVLMTDGENTPWQSGDALSEQQTYTQLAQTCEAMKALGITIYTITFQAPARLDPIYGGCATTPEHHFINAPTEAALEAAFGRIGNELINQNLRLIR